MTLLGILKFIGAVITVYFLVMIARELYKIATQKDSYNDRVDLP